MSAGQQTGNGGALPGSPLLIPVGPRVGAGVAGYAIVDREDEYLARYRWQFDHGGYAWGRAGTKERVLMHRIVLGLGEGDGHRHVDHINGHRADNRRANLRIVSAPENARNRRPLEGSTSRFVGVSWNARKGKWQAQCAFHGEYRYLGLYANEEDAAAAVDRYRAEVLSKLASEALSKLASDRRRAA